LIASGLPAGASYDSSSGFTWTPGNGQIGVHDVGFTVTDPHGSKSDLTVQITVNANVTPTLAAISSVSILAGESAGAQADASDTDDDNSALAYSLDNAPEGMQVSESGSITWATQSGIHSGEYTTDVVVTDSLGASASQQFKVVVDGAPVVESIDAITLKIGGKVKFAVAASDPEDGKLTYKALNNPDGFKAGTRNSLNEKFIWYTKDASEGSYTINIEVVDAAGLKSFVSAQIQLKANSVPVNEPSIIEIVAITRAPFSFSFVAKEGRVYDVQSSQDLRNWGTLKTYNGTGTLIRFEDERDQVFPQIYYRVRVAE
jgi:predicted heme/steroid binding protein